MKSKFKDYLLYTLSTIGVVALFISATTQPPQTSTDPESHAWEMSDRDTAGTAYAINKITGEVRYHFAPSYSSATKNKLDGYVILKEKK